MTGFDPDEKLSCRQMMLPRGSFFCAFHAQLGGKSGKPEQAIAQRKKMLHNQSWNLKTIYGRWAS